MQTKWLREERKYDGSQLRSLFAYENFGLLGDSIVGFRGACQIPFANMIDGEDRFAKETIAGSDMLHFIVEKFPANLPAMVGIQRLMAAILLEYLVHLDIKDVRRAGDDIYVAGGKLSISIATISGVSGLVHFALNVSQEGTPVKTASLHDFALDPHTVAMDLLAKFASEIESMDRATKKVFPAH